MWTRRRTIASMAWFTAPRSAALLAAARGGPVPDTRGWPSILDALPSRIQAAVRAGSYAGDLSPALRNAIETGQDFVLPPGIYPFAGDMLELREPGQRIVGTGGLLRRLPEADGIGVLVSAKGALLHGLRLDGAAPTRERSHRNDMVKVNADGVTLIDLSVQASWGSNLRLDGVRGCRVVRPVLTDAYQNNIIVCNAPTSDVVIEAPVCRRTATQDNIFVTASEASTDNGAVVTRVAIVDPDCSDAGDSGIELGYHCQDCRVMGGRVANSTRPALLQRDGRRNRWAGIVVANKPLAHQLADYDGVAVVPQWEAASWDSDTTFDDVTVNGAVRRSAFYWGQSGVRRVNCTADALAGGGPGSVGSGDLKAGDVSGIVVEGGRINGFATGDDWNFDARPRVRAGCVTRGVVFTRCDRVFSLYNVTPVRAAIVDNRGSDNGPTALLLTQARLLPSDEHPDAGLVYDGNALGTSAKGASSAVTMPADSPPESVALLDRDSRFLRLPPDGRVVAESPAKPGHYELRALDGRAGFVVVGGKDAALRAPTRLEVGGGGWIEVSVEKDDLLIHQRGGSRPISWIRLSGPGMRPN